MKKIILAAMLSLAPLSLAAQGGEAPESSYIGTIKFNTSIEDSSEALYWSVGTEVSGKGFIKPSRQVASSGIAQADFRLCTYEDGSPIFEEGKYFFCAGSRHSGLSHSVYSLDVNTSSIKLVGCVEGVDPDGSHVAISATHILYNRQDAYWYVFAHLIHPEHVLCAAKCIRDPRYGLSLVEPVKLEYESPEKGDEDNFIFYDADIRKWVLSYSKRSTFLVKQSSDDICGPYRMDATTEGRYRTLTGINLVRIGARKYFVAGSGLTPEEDAYKVFDYDSLSFVCDLALDIPTGGYRGWGTVLCVPEGMKTKYQLLTFDRINPVGKLNWNYGNIYLYEAAQRNPGHEYDIRRSDGTVLKADACEEFGPADLQFVRRFSKRLDFSEEIPLGELSLPKGIFLPLGNPYPVRDSTGTVQRRQAGGSIEVTGRGRYSLLCGSRIPGAEYVIDLSGMRRTEARYLSIGTLDKDLVTVRFSLCGQLIKAESDGGEIIFPKDVRQVRVIPYHAAAELFDATPY